MDNNNDNNNNDFNYVQEKIKSKSKKRIRKAVLIVCFALVTAVAFGFVARLVFVASEGAVNKLLGITPAPTIPVTQMPINPRSTVTIGGKDPSEVIPDHPTTKPTPTPTPAITPEEVTLTPVDTVTPVPSETPSPTETPVQPTEPAENPEDKIEKIDEESALETYIRMMSELKNIAAGASKSIIRVYSVKSGINWMDESVETRTELTGVIMADNGVELLTIVDYNAVSGADRVELEFADGTLVTGTVYSYDSDVGLAVVAVPLTDISVATMATYSYMPTGDSDNTSEGEPVIAIGRPNGYYGAVEFGFVSHTGLKTYFIDGMLSGFTTDMFAGENIDGVIVNLDGNMIGLIAKPENGMSGVVSVNSIKTLMVKLLNNLPVPYIGIRAENVPANILAGMGIENGIYINEVIPGSPAAAAELKKGDVILTVDEQTIEGVDDFYEYLMTLEVGSETAVTVYRSSRQDQPETAITLTVDVKQTNTIK